MRIPRLYLPQALNEGDVITLDDNTANHSVRVLRLKENAPVILFNGEGGEFEATIETLEDEMGLWGVEYKRIALNPEHIKQYNLISDPDAANLRQ